MTAAPQPVRHDDFCAIRRDPPWDLKQTLHSRWSYARTSHRLQSPRRRDSVPGSLSRRDREPKWFVSGGVLTRNADHRHFSFLFPDTSTICNFYPLLPEYRQITLV